MRRAPVRVGIACPLEQVLPPGASQADVYECAVSSVVDDVLDGFNGTIMAYGQVLALPALPRGLQTRH